MNSLIKKFFQQMKRENIRYCHWKSNNNLAEALDGVDDLDLLVHQEDSGNFLKLLFKNNFCYADDGEQHTPNVCHFYGFDLNTGKLIHLHVYFRLITGGSIVKNYWLALENFCLSNIHSENDVMVLNKEVDLLLFVVRKFLEQPSMIEHWLFLKDYKNIKRELDWLLHDLSIDSFKKIATDCYPHVDVNFFCKCIDRLKHKDGLLRRIFAGMKMRRVAALRRYSEIYASWKRSKIFGKAYLCGKCGFKLSGKSLFPGGKIIAFVGSEASGKSTLSKAVYEWLHRGFDVCHIHVGKPPKNIMTFLPWQFIKLYVRIKKLFKKATVEKQQNSVNEYVDKIHPLIAVLDSIDRYHLLKKKVKKMLRGHIVITDRYPTKCKGGIDSPRIEAGGSWLARVLGVIEAYYYNKIPIPDVVFKVSAPLSLTLERNAERQNSEPENFVRYRYEQAKALCYDYTKVIDIDSSEDYAETLMKVKSEVWRFFSGFDSMDSQLGKL
ncbi:MAG: hypothetical protein PVI75_02095 [Gammaproteobacteria bacterium]